MTIDPFTLAARESVEAAARQQMMTLFAVLCATQRDDGAVNRYREGVRNVARRRAQALAVLDDGQVLDGAQA